MLDLHHQHVPAGCVRAFLLGLVATLGILFPGCELSRRRSAKPEEFAVSLLTEVALILSIEGTESSRERIRP